MATRGSAIRSPESEDHRSFPYAGHRLGAAISGRGLVSDKSVVRIGQMLGVDSVLIYRIDGPTLRDRFLAHQHRDLPPVTVTSKIIQVESGEVAYHNVVTTRADEAEGSGWSLSDHVDYQRWSREAVDRGVMQTVFDLDRAFE